MRYGVLLAAALLLPASALAQDRPITLDEAVAAGLARHPSVSAAEASVERAEAGVREARAAWLPSFTVDGNATRFEKPMVVVPLHGLDLRNPPAFDRTLVQGFLTGGWTIFDGGARGARIDRARAGTRAAAAAEEASRQAVIAEVTREYLRVVTTRETREAHERRVHALEAERERAAQLYEQGRAARVVLIRADAALAAARADLVTAATEAHSAERELARDIGIEPTGLSARGVQKVAPPDTAIPAREPALAAALARSPEVERLEAQLAGARSARSEAKALRLPNLRLAGRWSAYGTDTGIDEEEWQSGVQLSWPLFTGGARRAAIDRAAAEANAAAAELDLARLRIGEALDRAIDGIASAHSRVAALTVALRQADEVVRIEKLALDTGAGLQTDYLAAVAESFRAEAALVEARAAETLARVELARVTGTLTPAWIDKNLTPIGTGR